MKGEIWHFISVKNVGAGFACTLQQRCGAATGAGTSLASDGSLKISRTDPLVFGERWLLAPGNIRQPNLRVKVLASTDEIKTFCQEEFCPTTPRNEAGKKAFHSSQNCLHC
jgi:hypothetical protein